MSWINFRCWLGFHKKYKLCWRTTRTYREWFGSGQNKTVTDYLECLDCGVKYNRSKTMGACVPDNCYFDKEKYNKWEIDFYKKEGRK